MDFFRKYFPIKTIPNDMRNLPRKSDINDEKECKACDQDDINPSKTDNVWYNKYYSYTIYNI